MSFDTGSGSALLLKRGAARAKARDYRLSDDVSATYRRGALARDRNIFRSRAVFGLAF